MRNDPYDPLNLNPLSPVSGSAWQVLGDAAFFLEEVNEWSQALKVTSLLTFISFFCFVLVFQDVISQQFVPAPRPVTVKDCNTLET